MADSLIKMLHTTNYINTLIEIAEDSPVHKAQVPPEKKDRNSVAELEYRFLVHHAYKYTSDDVIFGVYALRQELESEDLEEERKLYFSRGRPCMRCSPLTKKYGWGIHSDSEGRIALIDSGSPQYKKLQADETVQKMKAMRSSKK